MDIIVPTTLTTAMLVSSNIAENEYSEWEAGGFVAVNSTNYNWVGITRASSGNMYASIPATGIYKSTDNGVTWGLIAGSPTSVFGLCALGTNIYVCGNSKIYMDTGESGTFNDLGAPAKNWTCMCVSTAGDVYAGSTDAGIYKQTAGTGAFSQVNSTVRDYGSCCGAYDGSIYFAIGDGSAGSIFRSADGGTSFADLSASSRVWRGMTADANGHVYACAFGGDVYKRTNGTGSFVAIGGTSLSWYGMCYDEDTDTLYGCVYGGKVYSATGTTIYSDGDTKQVTTGAKLADHKIYESLKNNNASNNPVTDKTNWLLIGNTNRTKAFDGTIGAQSSKASFVHWVFSPGAIDSVALMNISATSLRVAEADHSTDKVTNGTAWTGATGTTQPTGWDKVGTPTNFTIDSGALKLTVDGNEGISQTIAVTAGTAMMLNGTYKNTSGDVAQIAIYDETHSSDILAVTDLGSSTQYATLNYIFSVPAGCSSLTIKLLAKTSGDIVWFDNISLSNVLYDSGYVTIGTYTSEYINMSLTQTADCLVRISVYNSGGNALVGEMVLGVKTNLGTTSKEISGGIKDYSTIEEDTYGYQSITDRGIAKKLSCQVTLPITSFNTANSIISYYHTTAVVWVASTTYNSTVIYGMYRDYKFQLGDKIATLFFDLQGLV